MHTLAFVVPPLLVERARTIARYVAGVTGLRTIRSERLDS